MSWLCLILGHKSKEDEFTAHRVVRNDPAGSVFYLKEHKCLRCESKLREWCYEEDLDNQEKTIFLLNELQHVSEYWRRKIT